MDPSQTYWYQPWYLYFYHAPMTIQPHRDNPSSGVKIECQSMNELSQNQNSGLDKKQLEYNFKKQRKIKRNPEFIQGDPEQKVRKSVFQSINTETPKNQKEGRNVGSNILRTFSKHLTSGKMNPIIQRIVNKFELNINQVEFQKWIQEIGISHRNYIRVPIIAKKLNPSCHKSRLFVLLLNYQNEKMGRLHILTSTKIKKQNKHLSLTRLRGLIEEILSPQNQISPSGKKS